MGAQRHTAAYSKRGEAWYYEVLDIACIRQRAAVFPDPDPATWQEEEELDWDTVFLLSPDMMLGSTSPS